MRIVEALDVWLIVTARTVRPHSQHARLHPWVWLAPSTAVQVAVQVTVDGQQGLDVAEDLAELLGRHHALALRRRRHRVCRLLLCPLP